MSAPLSVQNIKKSFGGKAVLDGVNLELKAGEIFGLIGLNGIGKTTLIKIIIDLLRANDGTVEIFGSNSKLTKSRRNIAYLPEKFQPSGSLKGIEFLRIFSGNGANDLSEIDRLAEMISLDRRMIDARISKYSKGMTQKLGLISVFLGRPKLVVLDEPMSGLDPQARIYLKRLLKEYKNSGGTVFFSSHILADLEDICDRIGILHGGKVRFLGTHQDLKVKHKVPSLEEAFLKEINVE